MNIKASVYDLLAYIIPGGFLLLTTLYALNIFGVLRIDILSLAPTTAQLVVVIGFSYIIGWLFRPIGRYWSRLFKPKRDAESALIEFKKIHPSTHVNFEAADSNILFAHIKRQNKDIASDIEGLNASSLMLRHISVGLIILAVVEIANFSVTLSPQHLFFGLVSVVFSILAGKESNQFAQWYFHAIFENIVAQALQLPDPVESVKESKQVKSKQK